MVLHKKNIAYKILKYSALISTSLLLLPILSLLYSSFQTLLHSSPQLEQIFFYSSFLWNTCKLAFPTALLSSIIGFFNAWTISSFQFPFRKLFALLLLIPLTIPLFINSMIWIEFLDVGGYFYSFLKSISNPQSFNSYALPLFKNIRSYPVAIFVYSILLYPYAYLIGLNYFSQRDNHIFLSAMSLGTSKISFFFKIELFFVLPYFFLACTIIILEIIADYGAAEIFALPVVSVGIFNLWTSRMQPDSAIILSLLSLAFISLLIASYLFLSNKKYFQFIHSNTPPIRITPHPLFKSLILSQQILLLACSTLLPLIFLTYHSWLYLDQYSFAKIIDRLFNSFSLVLISVPPLILLSLAISLAFKYCFQKLAHKSTYLIYLLSYGLPGIILALGSMSIFIQLDQFLNQFLLPSSFFMTSGSALVITILSRFSGLSISNLSLAFQKIPESIENTAFSFLPFFQSITRILIPLISKNILLTSILITSEILRELPITMLLRPFDFDTLAIYSFSFASEEMIEISSLPSLILVILNFALLFLILQFKKSKENNIFN